LPANQVILFNWDFAKVGFVNKKNGEWGVESRKMEVTSPFPIPHSPFLRM
jgi:hypothetical protein